MTSKETVLAGGHEGRGSHRRYSTETARTQCEEGGNRLDRLVLRSRADEIATLMTMEQGKPVAESKGETLAGADEGPAGEPLIEMEHQPHSTKNNSA